MKMMFKMISNLKDLLSLTLKINDQNTSRNIKKKLANNYKKAMIAVLQINIFLLTVEKG